MSTKREQVLSAVETVLNTMTGVTVYRARVAPFLRSEAPAVLLTWQKDTPQQNAIPYLDWSLQFKISVIVRSETPDVTADSYVADMHTKLMADISLGGLLMDLQPAEADLQVVSADQDGGIVTSSFIAIYRTKITDLTTS